MISSDISENSKSSENISRPSSHIPPSSTTNLTSELQQSKVQFYDHRNRYEGSHNVQPRVERIVPHTFEPDASEAAELESQILPAERPVSGEAASTRLQVRGQQALVRQQLHQDYRKLLGDLQALAREERLIRSSRIQGLPVEIFLEDHRRRELYIKRQKNMDSAFESIYYNIHQDTFSQSSSAAASVISQPQWEAPVQDSPAKLNVADWLSSVHNGSSPVNIINVATSRKEPVVIDNTAESESRRNTLEDLMKRINFQRSLLMTELAKQGNLTQGNLIPHIDNNLSHHTTSENDIFRTSSSFDENYDKLSSYEQIRDPNNGETLIETQQHIKPEGSSDKYENYKKEDVEMLIKRNTVEHDIGESREKELGSAEKSKKPSKENAESEKKDNCVSKGEENERIKVQTMLTHELNAHDLGSQPKIDEEESVTVLSEYSFDMSISKTQGHSGESSIENNDSNSASYEGVKIIVSVSELTEKKFQQTFSETSKESSPKTSPKTKKHDKVGRKLCKQKHKLSDKMPIEKERPSLQTSRHVSEKGTMTTEACHRSEEKKVQSIKNRGKKREDNYIKRSKWSDVINKDVGEAKDSSEVSTTYLSPPDQLSLSHIRNLVSSICNYKEKTMENASRIDPTLAIYISRLLVMSRESVENLNVSTSDVSTPDTETNTNNVTDTVSHRIPSPTQEKQTVEDTKRSKLYTDFRSDDVLDTRIQKQTSENSMRSKKYTELKIDNFLGSTSKQAAKCKTRNEIFTDFETGRAMDHIVQKETVKESTRNQTYSNLKSDSLILSEVEKQTSEDNIRSTIQPDLRNDIVMNTPLQKERFEVSTIIEINRDLKTDVTDTVEILTDTQREEAKVVSNRLSHSPKNTLLPLQTTRDSLMSDSYSFSEFRLHGTQNQSVSTPENVDRNNVIDKGDQLHSSCRCEGNLCEFNIQTPPFPSIIADMSLDEYKTFKFPEFFSEYAEKCSERISHLTKKIEEIRGEKKKLMASSSSSSSASSSSSSERGFDSTKYLSPPESSVVMTHVSNKDKGQTAPRCVESSSQVAGISTDGSRIYESQEKEEKESVRIVPLLEPYDASVIDTGQKPRKDHHPHSRPPPCLWKHKLLQSVADTAPIKELSTIIEADTTQLSFSSMHDTKEGNREQAIKLDSGNEDTLPDVMTEMLRRGLITSPLAWTKTVQSEESEMSGGSGSANDSEQSISRRKLSPFHYIDRDKFKEAILESFVGKGTDTPEGIKVRKSIADKKIAFSQQIAETFAKLGKNPSRTDVKNAFKNLGLKWKARGRDQSLNPVIAKKDLDPASEEFRQQVLESFVGLGLDSSPKDLEAAFRRLGLECPGGSLCICDNYEFRQNRRHSVTPESSATILNDSDCYKLSSSASSTTLPPLPSSDSEDSDGNLSV
ncbi:uncharacterized protein [Periplaneta americana]|uniref:uncharacterized protein isoform X2 n=1 Tax=Periplaneta americana TaxID=6978 RepID=UPI0037E754EA